MNEQEEINADARQMIIDRINKAKEVEIDKIASRGTD